MAAMRAVSLLLIEANVVFATIFWMTDRPLTAAINVLATLPSALWLIMFRRG